MRFYLLRGAGQRSAPCEREQRCALFSLPHARHHCTSSTAGNLSQVTSPIDPSHLLSFPTAPTFSPPMLSPLQSIAGLAPLHLLLPSDSSPSFATFQTPYSILQCQFDLLVSFGIVLFQPVFLVVKALCSVVELQSALDVLDEMPLWVSA